MHQHVALCMRHCVTLRCVTKRRDKRRVTLRVQASLYMNKATGVARELRDASLWTVFMSASQMNKSEQLPRCGDRSVRGVFGYGSGDA